MRFMECAGLVADKFYILLRSEDTTSNKLKIPTEFCSKYGELLSESMELKLRNGYILPVQIDLAKFAMKGFLCFFKDMELKGGEYLLFEYFGRFRFNVYIIGENGSEIRYPDRVHCLQQCSPGIVTLGDGGWRFLKANADGDMIYNTIDPPAAFINRCGYALPKRIVYVLSNGKKFVGSYNADTCRFSGLNTMFEILGIEILVGVRSFLFTYDGTSVIWISAFDSKHNEIVFKGTPLCRDASGRYPMIGEYFTIDVETKHMMPDCFVVEISNEFKELFVHWDNFHCITIFSGSRCWRVLTRKRDDYYCPTIEDGWQKMRDDLGLIVGNHCVFECATCSYDQFRIRVLPPDEDI